MNRRALLLAGLLPLLARPALAQSGWPDRVIRIVVPFAAGSFTDIAARLLATELTEQLGHAVVVENRGGAGSTAGTQAVARAEPDGYTLVLSDISLSISPAIYPKLPYDPLRDLAFISRIADSPALFIVRPGLGVRTLAELIALANRSRANSRSGQVAPALRRIWRWSCFSTSPELRRCTFRSAESRRRSTK
jgi:tripartite-type tricarboxylate transporter receptor subunit TctC